MKNYVLVLASSAQLGFSGRAASGTSRQRAINNTIGTVKKRSIARWLVQYNPAYGECVLHKSRA